MPTKTNNQIHIYIYGEIAKGKYHPGHENFNNQNILDNLIYEANTLKINTLSPSENLSEYISNTDLLAFGYKKKKDYQIQTQPGSNGLTDVVISPLKIYDLKEVMDIPIFETLKTKSFVAFMGDEFERIKVKAEWVLENSSNSKITEAYALKNIQKAKKILYDAKLSLRDIQKTENPENIYILFILNLFLIRTILFYQKMFKPYLEIEQNTEEQLFHEILKELSLRKLCKLFPSGKSMICEYVKKSRSENTDISTATLNEKSIITNDSINTNEPTIDYHTTSENNPSKESVNTSKTFSNEKSSQPKQGVSKFQKIKLNGQINVLVDVFIQLIDEIEVPEGKFIETSRQNLKDFIVASFVDRNDKELSAYTVDTILKPYRTEKHIKKESPRKIDIPKIINRNNPS